VSDPDSACFKLAHHVPWRHPGALTVGAYAGICSGAEIVALETEKPAKRNAIFWVNKQLKESHTLLSGDAIEFAFLVIGFARNIARKKGIVDGISDRTPLCQNQDVLRAAAMIVDLVSDETGDAASFISQCRVLANLNIAGTVGRKRR
jgi:hypothetical protein